MTHDPLKPPVALLCKLGSIAIHAEEGLSAEGHGFDMIALKQLLNDSEVHCWLVQMDSMAMVPKRRIDSRRAEKP